MAAVFPGFDSLIVVSAPDGEDILPDQPNCLMYCGALTLQKRLQTFLVSSSDRMGRLRNELRGNARSRSSSVPCWPL